jgi:hypothetical protein
MDENELTNVARKWAISVGIIERAEKGIVLAQEVLKHSKLQEEELRELLQQEANQRVGMSIDVGGYRIDLAPNEPPVRIKL